MGHTICYRSPGIDIDTFPSDKHDAVGARGVMVIIIGKEHSDTSSNPGPD